jgi:predicted nucleic acid-binding protein
VPRRFVLDTNCFIAASRSDEAAEEYEKFVTQAAPGLYLSTVVDAELRAGITDAKQLRKLDRAILGPYYKRGRIISPSPAAWKALGNTLAWLVQHEGLKLRTVRRSFILDILLAYSCREHGAILVSNNSRGLKRISQVFAFDFVTPYPTDAP